MLGNRNVPGNRFTEVVDDQPRPGFLFHIFTLSGVEVKEINCIFELPEGGFLAPPEMVEFLDHFWWEFITIQVGSKVFERAIGNFNTQDP